MAVFPLVMVILLCWIHMEAISGAKILAVLPFPYRSHLRTYEPLLEEILKRGHSLTLLSSLPSNINNELRPNFTHIRVEKYDAILSFEKWKKQVDALLLRNLLLDNLVAYEMDFEFVENMINDPAVQELFHSKKNYDLIIVEHFRSEVFFAFGSIFHAPVMSITSQILYNYHNWMLGYSDLSHSPNTMLDVTENMSLVSRAINTGWNLFFVLYFEFYHLPRQQMLMDKYIPFKKRNVPTLKEMLMNISISLVNHHYALGYAAPCLPNIVNVAGIHFTTPKPLPQDIRKFMDEAEFGIIYLSLGSIIDPNSFELLGRSFINALEVLPQRIIMKWNRKLLPDVPNNILVREWLPQSDILNHPHCRLFITHGGYLSLLESLNASVPVLGIPLGADQPYNIAMVEYFELGKKIELDKIASDLPARINEVLNNPKYKENMQKRSDIFRNRLASPMDTAMYWIDHVIEHKDTSHLKSASIRLKWYELYSVDVLSVFVVTLIAIFYLLKCIFLKFIASLFVLFAKIQTWSNIKSKQRVAKDSLKND